jgi:hypothetical protein
MANGIGRFCRTEDFISWITFADPRVPDEHTEAGYLRDPGALVVDDFLTEEEEAKILESLEGSSHPLDDDSGSSPDFRLAAAILRTIPALPILLLKLAECRVLQSRRALASC